MLQCPHCRSFQEEGASFCSQCGESLSRRPAAPRARRSLSVLWWLGLVQLALVVAVVSIIWLADDEDEPAGAGEKRVAQPRASVVEQPGELRRPEEPDPAPTFASVAEDVATDEPLSADGVRLLVERTLVVLELSNEAGRPLRDTRGVVVHPDGVVLVRFRDLLGAHGGECRLAAEPGVSAARKVRIQGLMTHAAERDLALVRIEAGAEPYEALPMLAIDPSVALDLEAAIWVFSGHRAREARLAETWYRGVSALSGEAVIGLRLAEEPPVVPESFVALDASGVVIGLCRPMVDGVLVEGAVAAVDAPRVRLFVDPVVDLASSIELPVTLTLAQVTRRFWEGTFADLLARGRAAYGREEWAAAIDLLAAAVERAEQEGLAESTVEEPLKWLLEAMRAEAGRLRASKRLEEAIAVTERALAIWPEDPAWWLLLGELRSEAGLLADAILALLQARELGAGQTVTRSLEAAYLELAAVERANGDAGRLEVALIEGVESCPRSGRLRFELGKLYVEWEAWDDAIRLLEEAKSLDADLVSQADALLGRVDDFLRQRDAVVIKIRPGSSTIRARAVVDGRQELDFVIDTGATFTALSQAVAEGLGYDLRRADRVQVKTAAGSLQVPRIQLRSLSLEGYSVRNLDAIVLPPTVGEINLLGLNYLRFFRYGVDSARGEFRLERQ